jgi:hypothetical protein
MGLGDKYSEIKQFLSISEDRFDLDKYVEDWKEPEDRRAQVLEQIVNFIHHFEMFKDIEPFMSSVYICVKKTLEIRARSMKEFDQLLVKNALMRFIQEYITYSKLSNKEQVLDFLSGSLERLQIRPLIINLGILIKPMYQDEEYVEKIKGYEEVEVSYVLNNEEEVQIKKAIDQWLETQEISFDKQEELKAGLQDKFNNLINECSLDSDSQKCKELWNEVQEMLNMKLTVLSLMDSIPEEEFAPVKIK